MRLEVFHERCQSTSVPSLRFLPFGFHNLQTVLQTRNPTDQIAQSAPSLLQRYCDCRGSYSELLEIQQAAASGSVYNVRSARHIMEA